ncbi:MAG: DciA family protein [Gammaproteobacteria bacterium]|nr:DciA family protein [Gammaproteobacteria bacterium]
MPSRNIDEILSNRHSGRSSAANQLARLVRHTEERASWTSQFRALLSQEEAPRFEVANKRGAILTVHATSAAWATRLRFRVPELLPALRRLQDFSNIEQIRIRTAHRST